MSFGSEDARAAVLRRCGVEDAEVLALVGAATFLESYAGRLPAEAILAQCLRGHSAAAWRALLERQSTSCWLAELDGAPVGYVMLAAPDFPEFTVGVGDVELKRIYLFSRLHGLGAGQAMMELALRHATAAGAKRMLIGVHRANARALAFYGRNGFNEVGVRTFKLGSVMFDDLILGRML